MIRLNMLVEGQTEETFVADVLSEHLAYRDVMVSCRKASAGPIVAGAIGLPRLRERCAHFSSWLSRLEALTATSSETP